MAEVERCRSHWHYGSRAIMAPGGGGGLTSKSLWPARRAQSLDLIPFMREARRGTAASL